MARDDEGDTYYTSCECAPGAYEILTSNINCSSCTSRFDTGNCSIPPHSSNEAKPGYSCIAGSISCDQCPSGYDKSCSTGVSYGVGKKCGYGCFSDYCSSGYYAECSGCDSSYNLSEEVENANCSSCLDEDGTHYNCSSCDSGYHWDGDSCVEDEQEPDCSDYTLSAQLANADCDSCTTSGTTTYKCSCKSGYHDENGSCVEDEQEPDCSDYTLSSQLDNADCESCTSSGTTTYKCTCKIGYHDEDGQCVQDEQEPDCSDYTLSSQLANAKCETCSNSSGDHYKCTCNTGYSLKNGVCDKDCSGYDRTSTLDNAQCDTCSNSSGNHYKCSCNTGYSLKNGSCVQDCSDTCTTKGLLDTKPSCQAGETSTSSQVCGKTCFSQCECTSPCTGVDIPEHAHGTGTATTACGKTCYQSWECDGNYFKTNDTCTFLCSLCPGYKYACTQGSYHQCTNTILDTSWSCHRCVSAPMPPQTSCPTGYATDASDCGGSCMLDRYDVSGSVDGKICAKCFCPTDECPTGYATNVNYCPMASTMSCSLTGKPKGTSNGQPCYECVCRGSELTPCKYNCTNCNGPACSSVDQMINGCMCIEN